MLLNLLVEYNQYFANGMAYLGAALSMIGAFGAAIGQGNAAGKAVEAIGRQPEASNNIMFTMVIGQSIVETSGLYGLIIAFMLIGKA